MKKRNNFFYLTLYYSLPYILFKFNNKLKGKHHDNLYEYNQITL